jgi:serine/threonine-protein kinase
MKVGRGLVLSHRYTLTDQIAAGGMGEVWAAVDMVLDRRVAVKLLNPALSQESGFVERFRAEATCSAALDHPNITKVYDYDVEEGSPYLVMELVSGQPLSKIISERGPLSAQETVPILIQAARALDAAHRGGVVHRDVKPANILITADGTAKLTDFGIARLVDSVHLTQVGQILGTSLYLSPEQAMGKAANVSSDIYALGVVGHEMLAGHPPFDGGTIVATALAHIRQTPPQLPDSVPPGVRDVISAALAKDPLARPESGAAMARALALADAATASRLQTAPTQFIPLNDLALNAMPLDARSLNTRSLSTRSLNTRSLNTRPTTSRHLRERAPRRGSIILLIAAGVVVIGMLAAFALPGGSDATVAPATTPTTQPSPSPDYTTQSTRAVTVAGPPADTSSVPGRLDRHRDRSRGHDDKKDGKK